MTKPKEFLNIEADEETRQSADKLKAWIEADDSRAEVPFFHFILKFSNEDVLKILKRTNNLDILVSIIHVCPEIRNKIYESVSPAARAMLRKDVELVRFSTRRIDGRAAQLRILRTAKAMSKAGELTSGIWAFRGKP